MNNIDKLIEQGAELACKHEELRNEIINDPNVPQEIKDALIQAKKEFEETYKKISLDMTQIEFQREVGRLEVLGELLIQNKKR